MQQRRKVLFGIDPIADLKVSDADYRTQVEYELRSKLLRLRTQGAAVLSAIHSRLHESQRRVLMVIGRINRWYLDDQRKGEVIQDLDIRREDFAKNTDVIPVSDPNAATLSQRVVQYQAVIQMAQMAPDIYDLPQLHRGMLEVLGIKHADKLVPLPEDMKPIDPVSENMAAALKARGVAHRLIRMAGVRGVQDAVVEALFDAYFCHGADLGDADKLAEIGHKGGLDFEGVKAMLASDANQKEVLSGDQMARNAGIQGVPSFALQGHVLFSGAVPAEEMAQNFRRAWEVLKNRAA